MTNNDQNHGSEKAYGRFHRRVMEARGGLFAVATTIAILIGGIVEIVPMYTAGAGPETADWVTPYTPLEVAGRDIYIREGCYLCHSQWIRPMRAEVLRYGEWTRAPEYQIPTVPSFWAPGGEWDPTSNEWVRSTRTPGTTST